MIGNQAASEAEDSTRDAPMLWQAIATKIINITTDKQIPAEKNKLRSPREITNGSPISKIDVSKIGCTIRQ